MTVRFEPMTQAGYDGWRVASVEQYSQEFVKAGILTDEDARERGEADFARLLPDGPATVGHELYTAYDGSEEVGTQGGASRLCHPAAAPLDVLTC